MESSFSNDRTDAEFNGLLEKAQEAAAARDGKAVEEAAMAMLARATEMAMENPSPSQAVYERAEALEENGEWAEAELARKEILELALKETQPGFAAKAHWELAIHYTARGLFEAACAQSGLAVECARRSEIPTLVHIALTRHVKTLLEAKRIEEALYAVDEALTLLPNELLTGNSRACALALRARCVTALDRLEEAEANLREAAEILSPADPNAVMIGAKHAMALWWRGSSELCARRGDWVGALKAAELEVAAREEICEAGMGSTNALLGLAGALAWVEVCWRANGELRKADEAGERSDWIRGGLKLGSVRTR